MSKPVPDFIIEAAQVAVMLPPFKTVEETGNAIDRIALALLQAYSRGLEDAANHCAIAATNAIFDEHADALYKAASEIRALGSK